MLYGLVLTSYQSSELPVALDSSYGAGVVVFSIDNKDWFLPSCTGLAIGSTDRLYSDGTAAMATGDWSAHNHPVWHHTSCSLSW